MLDNLQEIAAIATAFTAVTAMWAVGKQEWRRPFDMWCRRVILAVLACVAMTHAFSPDKLPEVAMQFVWCAFLIVVSIPTHPRTDFRERGQA